MSHGNKAISALLTLAMLVGLLPAIGGTARADDAVPYVYYETGAEGTGARKRQLHILYADHIRHDGVERDRRG